MRSWPQRILVALLSAAALPALADVADPDPARFAAEIEAYSAWDSKNSSPADAILFVGSSSIRMWPTAAAFPERRVINRGFGGSQMSDLNHYFAELVQPYDASTIVVYEGDNDIEAGKSPGQVLGDMREFVAHVRRECGDVPLYILSIKPSKARWKLWPAMAEANRQLQQYAGEQPGVTFIDMAAPLLDDRGTPRDVYIEDGLHLNEEGYRSWNAMLAPYFD